MNKEEYERSKARLEEQHRATLDLIETAYQAQLRALDMVWVLQGKGEAPPVVTAAATTQEPPPPAAAKPGSKRRRSAPDVYKDVIAVYWKVPEKFTHHDVCQAIGYEPDRNTLYRCLKTMVERGYVAVEEFGSGNRPTIYRRTPRRDSTAQT